MIEFSPTPAENPLVYHRSDIYCQMALSWQRHLMTDVPAVFHESVNPIVCISVCIRILWYVDTTNYQQGWNSLRQELIETHLDKSNNLDLRDIRGQTRAPASLIAGKCPSFNLLFKGFLLFGPSTVSMTPIEASKSYAVGGPAKNIAYMAKTKS